MPVINVNRHRYTVGWKFGYPTQKRPSESPYWRLAISLCGAATQPGKKDIYGGYQSVRYGCHNQDQEIYINGEQRVLRSCL
jgi:hypothetical protein